MVFHLVGWHESVNTGGVLQEIDAIKDPTITYKEEQIIVPSLNHILGMMALGATIDNARLASPSLRSIIELTINPLNVGAEPTSPPAYVDLFENPIALVVGEALTAKISNTGGTAEDDVILVWLGDGPVTPYRGPFRTIKATGSTTLTAYEWTNVTLTFEQTLPRGRYRIVGMAAKSDGCIAARLVVPGQPWRPGVIGHDAYSDIQATRFRFGNAGAFLEFDTHSPPTVEFLSASADTTEEVWFDIVPVA